MSHTCRVDNAYKYLILFSSNFFFFFFFFFSPPSSLSLFLSDFDQGWKDYICWSRDALLSHQQFIADDNIFWANNKNTGRETS